MIGFDIVDLSEITTRRIESRFIRKIISDSDCRLEEGINASNIWIYWAVKESAYKSIPSMIQGRFNPLKIIVTSLQVEDGIIHATSCFGTNIIYSNGAVNQKFIEVVSCPNQKYFTQLDKYMLSTTRANVHISSAHIKEKILMKLNQIHVGKSEIQYSQRGKPLVFDGISCKENISISHHGAYAGWVLLNNGLENEIS